MCFKIVAPPSSKEKQLVAIKTNPPLQFLVGVMDLAALMLVVLRSGPFAFYSKMVGAVLRSCTFTVSKILFSNRKIFF
jgi:hypothetical protein